MERTRKLDWWTLLSLMVFAFGAVFILLPLALVLYKAVVDPTSGALTLDYVGKFFEKRFYWSTLVNSMEVTMAATFWPR